MVFAPECDERSPFKKIYEIKEIELCRYSDLKNKKGLLKQYKNGDLGGKIFV
jgi:hypothetical protein